MVAWFWNWKEKLEESYKAVHNFLLVAYQSIKVNWVEQIPEFDTDSLSKCDLRLETDVCFVISTPCFEAGTGESE